MRLNFHNLLIWVAFVFCLSTTVLADPPEGQLPPVAQSYADYIKLRKKFHITYGTDIAALETLLGTRVMELRGVVKGTFTTSTGSAILVDSTDGGSLSIDCKNIPEWVGAVGETPARLIVRATRLEEHGVPRAELLGVSPEDPIADLERQEEARRKELETKLWIKSHRKGTPIPGFSELGTAGDLVSRYAGFITRINPRLGINRAASIAKGILGYSRMYGVDARLITAMIFTESGFNPNAVSHVGAKGLGQLMPSTAASLGVSNSLDTNQNLYGTVKLVRSHLNNYSKVSDDYGRIVSLMLAAYNAGPGAVRKHGGIPPFRETQNYVRKVMSVYRQLSGR